MANLDDTVVENQIDGSGFEENRVTFSDTQKGDNGTVGTEIVIESIFDDNCVFDLMSKEKKLVGSGSGNGIVDGVLGRDVNISNGDVSYSINEESVSKKSDEKAFSDGNGRWNGEKLEDGDHGFRVGDLVWGKVRSYPWWPGQVYDPRDASDFAVKHSQEGRLLVAFFGDGSCSWCLPSQLVPFIENFDLMLKDGTSKSVKNAVQKAVDEVGRVLESRLICKCIQKTNHLARPVVANAGVRAGVLVPELDINQLSFPEYEPSELLTKVASFAKGDSVDNGLELGILRSLLSAFYNAKCGHPLASYNEPVYIEGLEDKDEKKTTEFTGDLSLAIEPSYGPEDDNSYNGGKQRSVAELMRKRNDGPPPKRRKKSANGSLLKRHRSVYGESGGQKRRLETDSEEKQKKIEWDEGKEEIENATSSRERKKSKYLSPPYTNLSWKIVKYESDKYTTRSPSPVLALDEGWSSNEEEEEPEKMVIDNDKTLSFSQSDINVPVKELLSEVEFAAVDPFFLRNNGSLDKAWGFVSAFRGSMFVHGADFRVYQQSVGNSENDDLISDVSLISQKIDVMMSMLEDYCSKISSEEKCRLKDEMKNLMENVETATDKVRIVAENASF